MEAARIASSLTRDERRALLVKGAPVPDSIWHGKYSDFIVFVGPARWTWSPKGLAVQAELRARTHTDKEE